jgi:hypothetical protein
MGMALSFTVSGEGVILSVAKDPSVYINLSAFRKGRDPSGINPLRMTPPPPGLALAIRYGHSPIKGEAKRTVPSGEHRKRDERLLWNT